MDKADTPLMYLSKNIGRDRINSEDCSIPSDTQAIMHLFWHNDCLKHHQAGAYHPESPERLSAIRDQLEQSGLVLEWITPAPANATSIALAHDRAYVDAIFSAGEQAQRVHLDSDTSMDADSLRAARLAAGAAIQAVDAVMMASGDITDKSYTGTPQRAFCAVRPPGHHAGRANAAGFCLFNNIAIAAYHALKQHGLTRVAVVDFDVHHGDGTENIVSGDTRILFCSAFQHPHYPFSGVGETAENILNLPLPAQTSAAAWRDAVEQRWFAALHAFEPELVLISAGFDSHRADPLGGFLLDEHDYVWITQALCRLADTHAEGRVVSSLEGGYDLPSLASSVAAHVGALAEEN